MKSVISLILMFFTIGAIAQKTKTDANIVGDVQCEGEHVPFINITIDGTTMGTSTDGTGHYRLINIPEGQHTLRVSGLGYKTAALDFTATENKTVELNFRIEKDALNIEEVVVSADRNQTNRKEAAVVVTSLNPKLMQVTQSVNLGEALCYSPGLRTETNCQNCGFSQLRMNGLEGHYSQLLINSKPIFSGLMGVYGLEMIPSNMIERVEVVRGGGSTLFGGNAIAGTVNILTKESYQNTFSLDNRTSLVVGGGESGAPALDEQINVNASVTTDDNKAGGYIYGSLRNRQGFDANDDGYTELPRLKNTTLGFNGYIKPNANSKLSVDGHRIDEFRRGGNHLDYLPHNADICEQLRHTITGGDISYMLFTNDKNDKLSLTGAASQVERHSYYGAEQDPYAYGRTMGFTSYAGANYTINSDDFLFSKSTTIFGAENSNERLHDLQPETAAGNYDSTLTKQDVNTLGAFVQQDWKSEKLNLSVGLRYDYYRVKDLEEINDDVTGSVLVPRISLLYKVTPALRLRAGYAKGYRAPQVFDEDLHIALISGERIQTVNSDNLKQETSHAFTASFNSDFEVGELPFDFLAEGFYTLLEDPFYTYTDDDLGANVRDNAEDGASVVGVNIELKSFITKGLEAQVGLSFQNSEYKTAQAWGDEDESVSNEFMRTPDSYGYAIFNWSPGKQFTASLSFDYTGKMKVPHFGLAQEDYDEALADGTINDGDVIVGEKLETSKAFVTTDLSVSYDFNILHNNQTKLQVYAGVKNLFNQFQDDYDKGVYRDAGYIYGPRQPRTVNFGIKFFTL